MKNQIKSTFGYLLWPLLIIPPILFCIWELEQGYPAALVIFKHLDKYQVDAIGINNYQISNNFFKQLIFPFTKIFKNIRASQLSLWISMLATVASLSTCVSARLAQYPVRTNLVGAALETTVDSILVQQFLEGKLSVTNAIKVKRIIAKYDNMKLNNETLKLLSDETSVDFAAGYFIQRIQQVPKNNQLQTQFNSELAQIKNSNKKFIINAPNDFLFLFVPGLLYQSKPETKGDLAEPMALLKAHGLNTLRVNIKEVGTVEENGEIIAAAIRKHHNSKIVLVSTSKGGPDVAHALGNVLTEQELNHVKGWVSIGGALKGSKIVDKTRRWPDRWILGVYGFFKGFDIPAVQDSLSEKRSLVRFQKQKIPKHIYILHYIGVPFSGSVIKQVKKPYSYLRKFGPNDGIVLLCDEILENGQVVLAVGYDHWFKDKEIDLKTLALTKTMLAHIIK